MSYYDELESKESQEPKEEGEQLEAIINDNNELFVPEQLELDLEY